MAVAVRDFLAADREWAADLIKRHSGGITDVARLGELLDPLALDGLVAELDGQPAGLATVSETKDGGMELVTLHADPPGHGVGSALLETTWQVARASGHRRLWLVTTNDNLDGIHFYLTRGMRLATVHEGAVDRDRSSVKPEIPERNPDNGVPIRDLIELELPISEDDLEPPRRRFPVLDDLNRLPLASFVHELQRLFEGAPQFLESLGAERPFADDEALIDVAFEVAHELPEEARVELVEAHPRIGAAPDTVSTASYAEQGYASESPDDAQTVRAYEELAMLNEIYERAFGFRYVVFVAGRPKTEIVPLVERALRNDREAELRRAVDDTIYIAADRLANLRQ